MPEKIKSSSGAMLEATGVKNIKIHVMPKKFFINEPKAQKAKGVGLLIFVGGAITIVGVLGAFYFFVFKKPAEVVPQTVIEPYITKDKEEATAPVKNVDSNKNIEKNETSERIPRGTDSEQGEEKTFTKPVGAKTTLENSDIDIVKNSTTTSIVGTTTKKIIISEIVPVPKTEIKSSKDSDGDGLTDLEEIILDTDAFVMDSDGDGYDDLAELAKLYNPAGAGQIITNSNIKKYTNNKYKYEIYYPDIWPISNIDGDESIMLQLDSSQYIQIVTQPNAEKTSLDDWFKEQFDIDKIDSKQKIYKKGWNAIKNESGQVVYLTHPDSNNIFIVTYNLGINNVLNYKNIFDMMVDSFGI